LLTDVLERDYHCILSEFTWI